MSKKFRIIFICTGNACRSQMAEGFARHYGKDRFEVFSAGVFASGLHPCAVEAMKEIGIDISHHTSDQIDPELLKTMDYVVTVCDYAQKNCPITPGAKKVVHWSIEDPIRYVGTPSEEREFSRIRDDLGERVKKLIIEIMEHE
ncbi:MAG: arsenate reductase [Deltaproteobacteria bacterium RIFCSPLOWO2_02_FULL_44_10]|nr:MAG: arsenate reductase [Deltaproteobacteria bacterium RIFCSPHIGHO2_02_FULL_44_16]OGQ45618.1 MAG: arsenate reductase [Deltaproteobacteria bacterium RIFCSPLOWO2_02_FULL_44_10]